MYQQPPLPQLGRMMVFIDGENLVQRYQDMINSGRTGRNEIMYERDTLVWSPTALWVGSNVVKRATYYTYVQGGTDAVEDLEDRIKDLTFQNYTAFGTPLQLTSNLTPCVFFKKRGRTAKGVDIQITLDILMHSYQDNLDTVFLVSGDGDFLPVLKEVQRLGKQVCVAAFSSGLNPKLRRISDRFYLLDEVFLAQ